VAAPLLRGTLLVERHEARQDLLVAERCGPAIGLEHEPIEALVQFLQDEDQSFIPDALLVRVQRRAGLELVEDVVHARERQAGMLRLACLAEGVELLGDQANVRLQGVGGFWKREGIEDPRFGIARVVAHPEPTAGPECPRPMRSRREHAHVKAVGACDADEHVVGQNLDREKLEHSMLGGLDGGDVAT
jgi:hypothetical protein